MNTPGAYPGSLGILAEGEEAVVAAARARGAGKAPQWISDWLSASRDLGGSMTPISKGGKSFRAWTFENLPSHRRAMAWKLGETPIGALVRYGDETVAYSVGCLRALRPHLISMAPHEAQFSLLNAAEQRVVDTAFRGFRASLLGCQGGYGVVKGYEYLQDHSQEKPVTSPPDGR